ncbi:MBL fold metallo-hydrolase, partial [Streptomyces sp. SID4985]|nr:MBL fold metallo-hydrolase [Streptomyces sp. SID4985]
MSAVCEGREGCDVAEAASDGRLSEGRSGDRVPEGLSGEGAPAGAVARQSSEAGPADLRLVPSALAAWAASALLIVAPLGWSLGVAGVCLVAGLLSVRRPPGGRSTWPRAPVAAVLLCTAAAAVSAGLDGEDVRRGPVPEAARRFATVTAEVELTGDPWLSRPRVRGDHAAPVAVLARAEVREVTDEDGHGGSETRTRSPVLLIVDTKIPPPTGAAGEQGRPPWLALLPSTRLRVGGRLAPPQSDGDRSA